MRQNYIQPRLLQHTSVLVPMASHYRFEHGIWDGEETSDDEDDEDRDPSEGEGGDMFAEALLLLKMKGKISARDVCVLSYYAKHAGLTGPAVDFAYKPSSPSGHFQRHLDRVLKIDSRVSDAYEFDVPKFERLRGERTTETIPSLLASEQLAKEVEETPGIQFRLEESLACREWASVYTSHPVVTSAPEGERVWPIALYVDGVPFQKRDSMLAFYIYNLVTEVRHLLIVIRKSSLCRCGCLGWCTLHPIMSTLRWDLGCLAQGERPRARHDGQPFKETEAARASKAGQRLMRAALVHIKGDWAEFVHTLALAMWNSVLNPCFGCTVTRAQLGSVGAMSAVTPPFPQQKTRIHMKRRAPLARDMSGFAHPATMRSFSAQ